MKILIDDEEEPQTERKGDKINKSHKNHISKKKKIKSKFKEVVDKLYQLGLLIDESSKKEGNRKAKNQTR